MKKLVLSLMMVGACIAASAQKNPVKFGVKAGVNFANLSTNLDEIELEAKTSFYVGATADLPVSGMFSIQPGISLSAKGAKYDQSLFLDGNGAGVSADVNLTYIEIPVNVLINISVGEGKVFVGAGPYYGIAIGGKAKAEVTTMENGVKQTESTDEDLEFGDDGNYKRSDFGVNFLGGYQLKNGFNIHAGYGLGLSKISNDISDEQNRVLSVGVGFSF